MPWLGGKLAEGTDRVGVGVGEESPGTDLLWVRKELPSGAR